MWCVIYATCTREYHCKVYIHERLAMIDSVSRIPEPPHLPPGTDEDLGPPQQLRKFAVFQLVRDLHSQLRVSGLEAH